MNINKNILIRIVFLLFNSIAVSISAAAQDSLQNQFIDISHIRFAKQISKNIVIAYTDKKASIEKEYSTLGFTSGISEKTFVSNKNVTRKAIIRFKVCNTADTAVSFYFFPGFYFYEIQLYRVNETVLKKLPVVLPPIPDSIGYRLITLSPKDTTTLVAELICVKTYINRIRPRLINKDYIESFIAQLKSFHNEENQVTYIFSGLLLMMVLFSLSVFFQGANPEFLYYSLYAFLLGGMLFTKAKFNFETNSINYFLESYLDFIFQGLGIIFYMKFMQVFLDTRNKYPFLHKFYQTGMVILLISLFSFSYLHFFSNDFYTENKIENYTKVLLLVMILIFLVYSFRRRKDKLLKYLFWGNLCLLIFSLISQVTVMNVSLLNKFPAILNSPLFYYELGLFLELLFFLAGLNYKNRKLIISRITETESLKAQNLLQQYEKEIAVFKAQQDERERISADMHDELGSGMTAIRLMSEIARNKMKENTPKEIDKISSSANEVLNKMNAIIWSMNSENDTIDNLVSYIRSYAQEYFDGTPVQCKITTPDIISSKEISGVKRRNIFLSVKETLNNILKHAEASLVTININTDHHLTISIIDNGKGIDLQKLRQFGNGLKNINKRMESIGGCFKIENSEGTKITLTLPL